MTAKRRQVDQPAPQVPPFVVSLSVDLEGIQARSAREALDIALEAVALAVPSLLSGVTLGHVAHVVPESGPTSEWVIKTLKQVG